MNTFITYAQNREDVILDAFFSDKERGFYVDVGANHPIKDSATKHFYNKGWRGIDIEPIDSMCVLLKEDRPEDTILNVGVSDREGQLQLRQYENDGLSTFSSSLKNKYAGSNDEKTSHYSDKVVAVKTLKSIFSDQNVTHIDFMKIDAEGLEYEVIVGNDWGKYRPIVLCIEANHAEDGRDWRMTLREYRYSLVHEDGLNEYYLDDDHSDRKNNFSYVESMLLKNQVMPYHVQDRIWELEATVRDKDVRVELQKIHAKQLQKDKVNLEKLIIEQQRLKSTIKLFAKALDKFIVAHIENLRRPQVAEAMINARALNLIEYDTSSKDKLINSIYRNDLSSNYTVKSSMKSEKFYTYRIVKSAYGFIRRLSGGVLRIVKSKRTDRGFNAS